MSKRYRLIKEYPGSPKLGTIYKKVQSVYNIYCHEYEVNKPYLPLSYFKDTEFWEELEKTPLFTTEDCVDIFDGDELWYVDEFFQKEKFNANMNVTEFTRTHYFYLEDNASLYIKINEPKYSIQQMANALYVYLKDFGLKDKDIRLFQKKCMNNFNDKNK